MQAQRARQADAPFSKKARMSYKSCIYEQERERAQNRFRVGSINITVQSGQT